MSAITPMAFRPSHRSAPTDRAKPVNLAPALNSTPVERANQALIMGDLSRLTPEEKLKHYLKVCDSVGLNPATTPFAYCSLKGSGEKLYALKGAADQLREIHGVTIEEMTSNVSSGVLTVKIVAKNAKGRVDTDIGSVSIINLAGDGLANAMMKAVTKAKRRVTLSICGLGFLDESELETIPDAKALPGPSREQIIKVLNPPGATDESSRNLKGSGDPIAESSESSGSDQAPFKEETPSTDRITKGQQETIGSLLKEVGTTPDLLDEMKRRWGSSSQMTFIQAEDAISYLTSLGRISACLQELGGITPQIIAQIQEKFGITNLLQITSENGQGVISLLQELIG